MRVLPALLSGLSCSVVTGCYEWPLVSSDPTPTGPAYYVATNGNGSDDGSAAHPWQTLSPAGSVAAPGSMVHVAPGTYPGGFTTSQSGDEAAPIVYVSDQRWAAKIDGQGQETAWTNQGSHVTIQGFDISG